MKLFKQFIAIYLLFFVVNSSAELQPMANDELSAVNAQDGISVRLEIGLSANPNSLVAMDGIPDAVTGEIYDPLDEWDDGHLRARSLGSCDNSTGVNRDCTRRIAIEFPKAGTGAVGQDAPFAVLLDGFELAVTFEQINLDIEEMSNGEGALKVSFPGIIDISRLSIDKVSLLPINGTTNNIDLDATPTAALGDAGDNSLFGYTNNQVNLFGIDADITLQFGGGLYLFPVSLSDVNYGTEPAVASSVLTPNAGAPDCSDPSQCSLVPTFSANVGFVR